MSSATVAARNTETGAERATSTDAAGTYHLLGLAVGQYEITVMRDGFQSVIRKGVHLVVGQQGIADFSLQIGEVRQQITVTEEVSPVGTTTADISGLVGEQQVKNLPLNGRSYDLLMTLNPGVVNFTWEKTGGIGISNSTTANMFSVSGNRPQQNLFLLNGVEFTGAAENNMKPGGASGQLLGIDAVREFNILRDTYGAEYGKKPGGQVTIVTQSGTNQLHGSVFEFLRNNALDAPQFLRCRVCPAVSAQSVRRLGGRPDRKGQDLRVRQLRGIPPESAPDVRGVRAGRAGAAGCRSPIVKQLRAAEPVAHRRRRVRPIFKVAGSGRRRRRFSSPLQTIREDFGTVRLDHVFSREGFRRAIYTIDDSDDFTATPLDPFSARIC